jgi:ABC-type maltose transport system permease subunit
VYLPLMKPSLVAIGTYALLLAWNEYLYAFLLLSKDSYVTLAFALGHVVVWIKDCGRIGLEPGALHLVVLEVDAPA